MKEKFKKIIKNKYLKITLFFILWILILQQSYAVYVDMYNFQQLGRVNNFMKLQTWAILEFKTLKEFNLLYWQNIQPLLNCYYINNYQTWKEYTFWFKLYSLIFRLWNLDNHYVYPKYDLPYEERCMSYEGGGWECFDVNRRAFDNIISHSCKD